MVLSKNVEKMVVKKKKKDEGIGIKQLSNSK